MQMIYFQMAAKEEDGEKKLFGQTFEERTKFYPMYIESIQEVAKEDPKLTIKFLTALGFFGLNNSVYSASEKNLLSEEQQKESFKIKAQEEAKRQLFKNKGQEVVDGLMTETEAILELQKQYKDDPNLYSYEDSFYGVIDKNEVSKAMTPQMKMIVREKSPGARAILIKQIYGDINSSENAELKKELITNGVMNKATENYLKEKK